MAYDLFYWPGIQGRGEFVRLALEEAGAPYRDIARMEGEGLGPEAMEGLLGEGDIARPPFAPPVLRDGRILVAQTAAILLYLAPKLQLAPRGPAARLWAHQIQLTIADMVTEAHDAHHPIGSGLYYEDQKKPARKRAKDFRKKRIPRFFGWFESILARNPDGPEYLIGASLSYPDLSLFQLVDGLLYAFPNAAQRVLGDHPHLAALHAAVAERPRIAAYLASERRQPFNEEGIFRHYPELDSKRAD